MSEKFDSDYDAELLRGWAIDSERKRTIVKEHKTGPGKTEPSCYDPDKNGKCSCVYCNTKKEI